MLETSEVQGEAWGEDEGSQQLMILGKLGSLPPILVCHDVCTCIAYFLSQQVFVNVIDLLHAHEELTAKAVLCVFDIQQNSLGPNCHTSQACGSVWG